MRTTVHLSCRVSKEMLANIKADCAEHGYTTSDFNRAAIAEKLQRIELKTELAEVLQPVVTTMEKLHRRMSSLADAQLAAVAQSDMDALRTARMFGQLVGMESEELDKWVAKNAEKRRTAVAEQFNELKAETTSNGRQGKKE